MGELGRHLLTQQQVAEILHLEPRTLEDWRQTGLGGLPFVRVSRRAIRYRPEDVERFIADRLRTSTSATEPPEAVEA